MTSAQSLYRLAIGLAAAAVAGLAAATALALTSVAFRPPTIGELVAACRDALIPALSWPALAVALLGMLTVSAVGLGARSVWRQTGDARRYLRRLDVVELLDVDGANVVLIEDDRPQAFCAGLLRPRVYLSTAALITLDDGELRAVLAHERHHQQRRDPLRLLIAHAFAAAFFFLPVLRRLANRYAALAELAADEAAVASIGDRSTLASALLTFGERRQPQVVVGIAPERVDHLLGHRPRWKIPVSLVLGAVVAVASLIVVGAAVATATAGASMSLPFVLAQLCAVLVAALPAAFVATVFAASRQRLRRLSPGTTPSG